MIATTFPKRFQFLLIASFLLISAAASSQGVNEDQTGAWYMGFVQKKFEKSRFGLQGDYQFRFWDAGTDLEQILLRTGITYKSKKSSVLWTTGYAHIRTGTPGKSTDITTENRIYQEALIPHKVGTRFFLTHRYRFEQRLVEGQEFRTRFRYNIFLNVPLNKPTLQKNAVYLALYNEIFINGQLKIGGDRQVQYFDRNRTYLGMGYNIKDNLRAQLGWMNQTTVAWQKGQGQVSIHYTF